MKALLVAGVLAVAVTAGCTKKSSTNASMTPGISTASSPSQAKAQTEIGSLGNFGTYNSIDAAEAVAGFHIPRPPADKYSLAFGQTHIRGSGDRALSTTNYKFGPGDSDAIGVDVGAAVDWFGGGPAQGKRETIGGKPGWMNEDDSVGWVFSFECGETRGVPLWCQVTAPRNLGLQGLNDFVAALS